MTPQKKVLLLVFLATSNCGTTTDVPIDTPKPVIYAKLFDETSLETSDLVGQSFDPGNSTAKSIVGSFNRQTDHFEFDDLEGTISEDGTLVVLEGGGIIAIEQQSTDYVAVFSAQPSASNPTFGVIGVPTQPNELPTLGRSAFSGNSEIQIVDGNAIYDLSGIAVIDADFDQNSIDLEIGALSGFLRDGVNAPIGVSDVVDIWVDDAVVSGNSFSGGVFRITNSHLDGSLSGSEEVSLLGNFYGPEADEVGGVLVVNDSTTGSIFVLHGTFLAD